MATDTSGASAAGFSTIRVCPCPPPGQSGVTWPLEAQTGGDCRLTPIGSLQRQGDRVAFTANPAITRFTIGVSRITIRSRRIALIPLGSTFVPHANAPFVVRTPPGSIVINVRARTGGLTVHQQFLVPYRRGRPISIGQLRELACDGTAATILTPAFRGPGSQPLRIQVRGRGRLIVLLASAGGKTLSRQNVKSWGKTLTISFPVRALPPGVYTVTVSPRRSPLHQALTLNVLALGSGGGGSRHAPARGRGRTMLRGLRPA
jgi:hypothetical protein